MATATRCLARKRIVQYSGSIRFRWDPQEIWGSASVLSVQFSDFGSLFICLRMQKNGRNSFFGSSASKSGNMSRTTEKRSDKEGCSRIRTQTAILWMMKIPEHSSLAMRQQENG